MRPHAFQQVEFGFPLGPGDGRFLIRAAPGGAPDHVLVLGSIAPTERTRRRDRRGRPVEAGDPTVASVQRATLVRPEPFAGAGEAAAWLEAIRSDADRAGAEIDAAFAVLAQVVRAYRAARADPGDREPSPDQALVARIGYGDGYEVADGRYADAWELPRESRRRRRRRSMEAPEERFAALLGAREAILPCEELVLRARTDLDARRLREAALQARIALESLLADPDLRLPPERRAPLDEDRAAVGAAANAALAGELGEGDGDAVVRSIARMEAALAARRLSSAGWG